MSNKTKTEHKHLPFFYIPDVLEKDDSSVNFPDNQHEDGHSIAAKQIQRLCPSVDATSLQDKGKSPHILNANIGRFPKLIYYDTMYIEA